MHTVPLELPVSAAETGAFAELVLDQLDRGPLTDEARNRVAMRAGSMRLSSFTIHPGSIAKDPIHPSTYYVAVDAHDKALLLRVALASSPSSGLFPHALLIGRMHTASGREIVVNAVPFASTDHTSIGTFAEQVDTSFLPRPQGGLPAIAVQCGDPEAVLPAAFEAFRAILKRFGVNVAAVQATDGFEHFYYAAAWAAIRAGWREGYTVGADIDSTTDVGALVRYTKFTLGSDPESVQAARQIYDSIQRTKAGQTPWRKFDFEGWPQRVKESGKSWRLDADLVPRDRLLTEMVEIAEKI
jgi:hypothetical protein